MTSGAGQDDRDRIHRSVDGDYMSEDEFNAWMLEQQDFDGRNPSGLSPTPNQNASTLRLRNLPVASPFVLLSHYEHNGIALRPESTVELLDGDFLRILDIIQNISTLEVSLRGWIFQRTKSMNGLLEKKMNELCWVLHVDMDDSRDPNLQGMETVTVTNVLKRRRIRLTNRPFPALSFREHPMKDIDEVVVKERVLVCRIKYVCYYITAENREKNQWCERAFLQLVTGECDSGCNSRVLDHKLRSDWRGLTVKGGASSGWLPGEKEHLRQERITNRGISIRQSLQSADLDFPIDDAMNRGGVGNLVAKDNVYEIKGRDFDDSRENHKGSYDSMRRLSRDMRRASIDPTPVAQNYPRVTKIGTHVKTWSCSGVLKSRYEGKITETFSPAYKRKAKAMDASVDVPRGSRPVKRVHGHRHVQRSASASDSDATIGRSVSPKPFDEIFDPTRIRDTTKQDWPLLKPLLQPKAELITGRIIDLTKPIHKGNSQMIDMPLLVPNIQHPTSKSSPYTTPKGTAGRVVDLTTPRRVFRSCSHPTMVHFGGTPLPLPIPQSRSSHIRLEPRKMSMMRRCSPPREPAVLTPSNMDLPPRSDVSRVHQPTPNRVISIPSQCKIQRYTIGDCFCGAGGMSRGALMAGLRVEWGFDFDLAACQAYNNNFFGTTVYNLWANEFSQLPGNHRVDILHMSPPCQFFSPMHTQQGKDDEMNTASLFAMPNLLDKARPRIVILEQTAGLIRRHQLFFNALIHMLTQKRFSVRWRLINCADFGLPQRRLRLFIIASW